MDNMFHFDTEQKAKKHTWCLVQTATDVREKGCIARALAKIPHGSNVLILPCGTGKKIPLLKELGYIVTAADPSIDMIAMARHYTGPHGKDCIEKTDSFHVVDIYQTKFADNCFDAVIFECIFSDIKKPELRYQVLEELRRICAGPIVFPLVYETGIIFALKNLIRTQRSKRRVSIDLNAVTAEIRRAGLVIEKWIPLQPFFSKEWYIVLKRPFDENE